MTSFIRDGAALITTQGAAGALLDQAWHGLAPGESVAPGEVDAFEHAVLSRHGLDLHAVGLNYHSAFFSHIFDGPYGGTLYAYLWSALLESTALRWLDDQGGLTRAAGQQLRDELLARGAVVDPLAALRAITGREPTVAALLERRGLA